MLIGSAAHTPEIADGSVSLVVTSPPFLDVVDYRTDNWLRCWFNGIEPEAARLWQWRRPEDWQRAMTRAFGELFRVVRPGGFVAFGGGEVQAGSAGHSRGAGRAGGGAGAAAGAGERPGIHQDLELLGVDNRKKGTNTNRIVLLARP